MTPKISVIITSKNSSKTIKKLLDSVFDNIDKRFFEVIVVDSSNDGTIKMLREYPAKIFKLPYSDKRKVSQARNLGLSKAQGEFIYFVDADSYLLSNWQTHLKDIFNSRTQIFGGSVFTEGRIFDYYCQNSIKSPMRSFKKPFVIDKSNFYLGNWPLACNLGVRKSVFKRIGSFDEKMENYEEVDFLWRACKAQIPINVFQYPKTIHSYQASLLEGMKTYFRYGDGFSKFLKRYPFSVLSISRVFTNLIFTVLTISLFLSAAIYQKFLPYYLIPISFFYAYYLSHRKFHLKLLALPFFDILYAGISYNAGVWYSLLKSAFLN